MELREELKSLGLTVTWLLIRFEAMGFKTDMTEVSHVLAGRRTGPKADEIKRRAAGLIQLYKDQCVPVLDKRGVTISTVINEALEQVKEN